MSSTRHPGIRAIYRRFEVRGENGPRRGNGIGHDVNALGGNDEARLMRMEREYRTTGQSFVPALDATHHRVPVLHGRGKVPSLKRSAHPGVLARWHTPFKDERLRPTTDTAVQCTHDDVAGRRRPEGFSANLSAAGCGHPECSGVLLHTSTF